MRTFPDGRELERWSPRWVTQRRRRPTIIAPRIGIALLLPMAAAFYSVELALLLALPCGYVAWTQLRSLWPDL